ncbi:MAG: TolB family protein [Thermoanaerobaculia bacterium]
MRLARALMILFASSLSFLASAQSARENWQTLHTAHFRVHYTSEFEPWARRVASKLESIRTVVGDEVGFLPSDITDVIVADPMSQANGSAWPFLGSPRMIFWASPPSPAGALGHESDWGELLAIHEWVHVAHLTRPTRRPLAQLKWALSPVSLGPISTAPRWISEGYATVLEGKLTGQGRPYSDYRAAILRTWAQAGRLPSYESLHSDASSWMGMSMAYLAGSAYLEWLVEREGEESLRSLWARMTARQERSFDAAFEGVYGDSPKRLYQRFAAELTHKAMLVEQASVDSRRPGELWMDLSWSTSEPDISHDGRKLVTIVRGRNKPARVAVFSTEPDDEAEAEHARKIEKMLAADPEDVGPVRRKPLQRKPKSELVFRPREMVSGPRWIGETGDVLVTVFAPDKDGSLHPDIFRWSPGAPAASRLTYGADLRDVRPSKDGTFALAIRNRFGFSEVVLVDLGSGECTTLAAPTVDGQFAEPALHPDMTRFAMIRRREGKWELVVRALSHDPNEAVITFDGIVAQPAWSRDGRALFATVARGGFIEISRFDYDATNGTLVERGQVTRGAGASFSPAASEDALWFLGLDPDGLDLRRMPIEDAELPLAAAVLPADAQPALVRVFEGSPATIVQEELAESAPYGVGRQELSPLFGGGYSPSGSVFEAGLRVGDILGRLETLAIFSAGTDGAVEGGSVAARTRMLPVDLGARFFAYEELPSKQKKGALSSSPDHERLGLEAWLSRDRRWRGGSLSGSVAIYGSDVDGAGIGQFTQLGSAAGVCVTHAPMFPNGMLAPLTLDVSASAGDTDDESWTRVRGALTVSIASGGKGATLSLETGTAAGDTPVFEQFEIGGARGSILPDAATANRIDLSALPAGILRGRGYDSARIDVRAGGGLPALFVQRVQADVPDGDEAISLAGIEWSMDVDAMPIARIPALELRMGAAHVLDEGLLEDETSFWVTVRWKP